MDEKISILNRYLLWAEAARCEMFRGQTHARWPLLPSIVRYAEVVRAGYRGIAEVERHLVAEFEKYALPFNDYRPAGYVEKLIHAQHHGLPTRLLDWTSNPLKAMYFAVDNPDADAADGVVVAFSPTRWWEKVEFVKLDTELATFYPELVNERVGAQEGCFTSFPLPEDGFDVAPFDPRHYPQAIARVDAFVVPAGAKREIRRALSRFGINQRTIYPGLDGVARWVRSRLADYAV
ncbi:MAG TPA: FRG domain-containing protein [Lysobacter sp.]|nr:FRG domain-containing protein [Lysobacter sp.]